MNKLAYMLPLAAVCMGCSHKATAPAVSESYDGPTAEYVRPAPIRGSKPAMIPKATAFRMSGDYAGNVAITLNAQGDVTYFPAPSDISGNSRPIDLGGGWWLNRQGIGPNSVFTKYTFEEYRALNEVPSAATLKEAVIPEAKVIEMVKLPYSINDAASHIKEIKDYLDKK